VVNFLSGRRAFILTEEPFEDGAEVVLDALLIFFYKCKGRFQYLLARKAPLFVTCTHPQITTAVLTVSQYCRRKTIGAACESLRPKAEARIVSHGDMCHRGTPGTTRHVATGLCIWSAVFSFSVQ
jgi:hypothetical protein